MKWISLLALLSVAAVCRSQTQGGNGGAPGSTSNELWITGRTHKDLQMFAAEPHPMGSARNAVLADYIDKEMKSAGLTTFRTKFEVEVPDPELLNQEASMMQRTTIKLPLENVQAKLTSSAGKSCVYLLGSHYDSKRLAGQISVGANDSGSSSATLMELMRILKERNYDFRCHIMAVWFDGEEAYLPNWRDGETRHPAKQIDNTYGSRYFVNNLKACGQGWCTAENETVEGLILLDMIGEKDLKLSDDANSTGALRTLAKQLDKDLLGGALYSGSYPKGIEDDHIPFLAKGIPAIDLIGFENTQHWHQPTDTLDKIDDQSLSKAALLTEEMLKKLLL